MLCVTKSGKCRALAGIGGREHVTVVLKDISTGEYFAGAGLWAREEDRALNFPSSLRALEFASQAGRDFLEVVMSFGDPVYDVRLQVAHGGFKN